MPSAPSRRASAARTGGSYDLATQPVNSWTRVGRPESESEPTAAGWRGGVVPGAVREVGRGGSGSGRSRDGSTGAAIR